MSDDEKFEKIAQKYDIIKAEIRFLHRFLHADIPAKETLIAEHLPLSKSEVSQSSFLDRVHELELEENTLRVRLNRFHRVEDAPENETKENEPAKPAKNAQPQATKRKPKRKPKPPPAAT